MTNPDSLSIDGRAPGLLAPFAGTRPPAPDWFTKALADMPERLRVLVEGAEVEVLVWGERGRPGLLLLHGNGAHADWWSPLAPLLAADGWRVAALSWSGMGGSDWRPRYIADIYGAEMRAAAAAAGIARPVVLAHSFGGFVAAHAASRFGDELAGVVVIDTPIEPPDYPGGGPPKRTRPNPVYATEAEILARFRLAPPQDCTNLWYLDHVARGSVHAVEGGFTWRFDPFVMTHLDMADDDAAMIAGARCPLAVIYGDRSYLMPPVVVDYMRAILPAGSPFLAIPDAAHHLMVDQPLPFVAGVRGLLAGWPR